MTLAAWIWLLGGLPVGVAIAIAYEREEHPEDWTPGLILATAWLFSPLVVSIAALLACLAAVSWLIRRAERRLPRKTPRGGLQARIEQLEHELLDKGDATPSLPS